MMRECSYSTKTREVLGNPFILVEHGYSVQYDFQTRKQYDFQTRKWFEKIIVCENFSSFSDPHFGCQAWCNNNAMLHWFLLSITSNRRQKISWLSWSWKINWGDKVKEIGIKNVKVSAARPLPISCSVGASSAFSFQLPSDNQLLPNLPLKELGSNWEQSRKTHFPPRLPLLQVTTRI